MYYRLRGSPSEENWPGVSKLPDYKVDDHLIA